METTLDNAKNINSHVIFISSSMVYGNFKSDQVDEDSICNPIGIYGNLKLAGELMIKSFNQVFGLPYTIIRPSHYTEKDVLAEELAKFLLRMQFKI